MAAERQQDDGWVVVGDDGGSRGGGGGGGGGTSSSLAEKELLQQSDSPTPTPREANAPPGSLDLLDVLWPPPPKKGVAIGAGGGRLVIGPRYQCITCDSSTLFSTTILTSALTPKGKFNRYFFYCNNYCTAS